MRTRDPEKARTARREWYYRNREREIALTVERKRARRSEIKEWLRAQKPTCIACGESDPVAIEFHHILPSKKEIRIGDVIGNGWSLKRIEKEINKCCALCATCHRKVHGHSQDDLTGNPVLDALIRFLYGDSGDDPDATLVLARTFLKWYEALSDLGHEDSVSAQSALTDGIHLYARGRSFHLTQTAELPK